MPIHVELVTETGEVEGSAKGCGSLLGRIVGDEDSRLVRYIDPYGDTYFNRLQVADFLEDWEERYPSAGSPDEQKCWHEVKALAQRCAADVHTYLRFVGD
jgi:hypothetical protein